MALVEVSLDARDWGSAAPIYCCSSETSADAGVSLIFRIESETTVGYATGEVIA